MHNTEVAITTMYIWSEKHNNNYFKNKDKLNLALLYIIWTEFCVNVGQIT